ncbi:MAG: serine--tRNA ligase [Bacteroidetes bacterium]|jgi:seryl-tRNA synthetase|nr:serine--tRNA ligase [Bacteroidota bacterium]
MLQVSEIRENKQQFIEGLAKRGFDGTQVLEEILQLDEQRRSSQAQLDEMLAQSNRYSREIGELYKKGQADEANALKEKTTQLKEDSKALNSKMTEISEQLLQLLYTVPNVPHELVNPGKDESDNEEVFLSGVLPQLADDALPHWELAKKHGLIDFELGVKVTGAGFPVYKNQGARLQRALITYFLDKNIAAGYTEYQVPLLVNEASGYGTGQLPDKEGQMYHVQNDDLYLIPTSEVPITNMFRDNLLELSDFPIKCTGYTPCFRREAGSYGAHVRGLNRLHQFDKVEIVRIEHPDNSYKALDAMVEHIKSILEELGLTYRILRLCGGDLGFTSAMTYDFEVYSAAQKRWLEISSVSNFETYQANRLKLRFKDSDGKNKLAHTLNGSSLALPRVLAAILENFQQDDGIKIPEVLVPYCGFDFIK